MRTITLKAEGQRLTADTGGEPIIAGTKGGYLQLLAELDSEWTGYDVAVQFWNLDDEETAVKLRPGMPVKVPDTFTDYRLFRVSLYGARGNMRLTTNKVSIRQRIA